MIKELLSSKSSDFASSFANSLIEKIEEKGIWSRFKI
jgi:hypothetical protein